MHCFRKITMVLWFALVGTACAAIVGMEPDPPQRFTINVLVKDAGGNVLEGIPVGTKGDSGCNARTNGEGRCSLQAAVPSGQERTWVCVLPATDLLHVYPGRAKDTERYLTLLRTSTYDRFVNVDLVNGQASYDIVLTAVQASVATGRVVATDPRPGVVIMHERCLLPKLVDSETGQFELVGIPRSQPYELFLKADNRDEIKVLSLSAEQTSLASVELGDISMWPPSQGREVQISVTDVESLAGKYIKGGTMGVVLVSADGTRMFDAHMDASRTARVPTGSAERNLKLPPGTYYACTGLADGYSFAVDLYRHLKAGRLQAVIDAGVPQLVVPDDGQNSVIAWTFSASLSVEAVRGIH